MRLLWLTNKCLPAVAKHRGLETGNREGWLAGISERLLQKKDEDLVFGNCFPVRTKEEEFTEHFEVSAYAFREDLEHPELYEEELEERLRKIVEDFKPDIIHIFGTEFPHTLAMTRAFPHPERILIGIQGICTLCGEMYLTGIPDAVAEQSTLRDRLKKDNIKQQQDKFFKRGRHEVEAIKRAGNITGRTDWDCAFVREQNPEARYFTMNETLRSDFYSGEWKYDACKKHSVFITQGDYPIKGLHIFLKALPELVRRYPDVTVTVAGQEITGEHSLKKRILISEYGKYIKELIEKENLKQRVTFTGNLSAEQMKEKLLEAHVFVLSSVLENSPNSLGEAMLLGVPCVASETGGVPSMISESEGYLYQDNDPEQLAEAVIRAFKETDGNKGMTAKEEAGRKRARETHDGAVNYEVLCKIYKEIEGNEGKICQ